MRIAWIGAGKLGAPMARHVVAAGHDVALADTDPARLALVPGARPARDAAGAADGAGLAVTSLPDDRALRAVVLEGGLLARLRPGAVLVDTSTVSPQACEAVRREAEARGVLYLAAPVSGSTATAEAAALTLLASGPAAALEQARPALATFARAIHHVGEGAEARYLKLAVNHFVGSTAQVAAEALTLARRGGVAWDTILDVLGSSAAASPLIAYKLDPLRRRDFAPAFSVAQMRKDMSLCVAAGEAVGVAMPVADLVRAAYARQEADLGALDFFAAVLEAERGAGLGEP
ncbi:3-hydroxyisobutyrate dehydrogenase [Methylobacterium crusticola]|uniref:3-hydroxyisobutyrate dehydrogenase n=1 Tax=Methylobacterium crusticola TaxID=1697972 RepID=A0ABQ4R2V2_9HYPH|nr:NAD(P)-dependent oxidoreductase [Methylobacterium crusticola]GJD51199.1 3-hydroxyisobutyrate dehydrogenase [Methylobacterium crusticola]